MAVTPRCQAGDMSSAAAPPDAVRAHSAPAPPAVRAHRREVAAWALANGRPIGRDALAAIVGARCTELADPESIAMPSVWTAEQIGGLLWHGVADWCDGTAVELPDPDRVADTLDTYLRHLSASRLLAPGSDPVAGMRRAIVEYGGRRTAEHPSRRRRPVAPVVPIA